MPVLASPLLARAQLGDVVMGNTIDDDIVVSDILGLGKPETQAGDVPRPRDDGEIAGRDRLRGRLLTIKGSVSTGDAASCLNGWRRLLRVWDSPEVRLTPGRWMPLTIQVFGAVDPVTVWCRPRELDPVEDINMQLVEHGRIDWVGQVKCVDHYFYGPEQSNRVGIVAASSSGLTWPVHWPLRWSTTATSRPTVVDVGGDADAYLTGTIYGPVSRPVVQVTGEFELVFDITLAADRFLSFSAAPWARGVWLDGNIWSSSLTPGSRWLSQARLAPGLREVVLRGSDPSGTASLGVSWRDCSRSL